MRQTKQRKVILDTLRNMPTHPTVDQVYDKVREELPKVSLGTVYRNLQLMSEAGVVMEIMGGEKNKRFDGNPTPHYHIRCTECGRIDDIVWNNAGAVVNDVSKSSDYEVEDVAILFYGCCPECSDGNS